MSEPIRTILVGVSSLRGHDPALLAAAALARHAGGRLVVVIGRPPRAGPARKSAGEAVGARSGEGLRPKPLAAAILSRRLHVPVESWVARIALERAVLDLASELSAEMVVIGAPRHAGGGTGPLRRVRWLLGRLPVPVLVVRSLPVTGLHALVTTDLSSDSADCLNPGLTLLARYFESPAAETRALHVIAPRAANLPIRENTLRRMAGDEVRRFLAGGGAKRQYIAPLVRFGPAAERIVEEAERWPADLVLLGSGRAASGAGLGCVAESVVRRVSANLLVVPPSRGSGSSPVRRGASGRVAAFTDGAGTH
jgi:nucleotide-binding universal stress UspA family protein